MQDTPERRLPPGPDVYEDEDHGGLYDPRTERLNSTLNMISDRVMFVRDFRSTLSGEDLRIYDHYLNQTVIGKAVKTDEEFATEIGVNRNRIINRKRKLKREIAERYYRRTADFREFGISLP